MDAILIIFLVVFAISAVAKRKKQQQEEAAKRQKAAAQAASAEEKSVKNADVRVQATPVQPLRPTVRTSVDTESRRHPLEASSATGHAHMESSLTGFTDCPPTSRAKPSARPKKPLRVDDRRFEEAPLSERLAAYRAAEQGYRTTSDEPVSSVPSAVDLSMLPANASGFHFDVARVRDGLLYAEIFGKPKALRRR